MDFIDDDGIVRSSIIDGVILGVSTKILGNMSYNRDPKEAPKNFQRFMQALGINSKKATMGILPVGNTSAIADMRWHRKLKRGRLVLEPKRENQEFAQWTCGESYFADSLPNYDQCFDAAVSKSKLKLLMLPADCAPVMLFDPRTKYFGLIHAGILGALSNIVPATVNYLRYHRRVQPANLLAYIGPCICGVCYEPTESRHWPQIEPLLRHLKKRFDLRAYLRDQLIGAGLAPDHIEVTQYCTACRQDLFFSNYTASGNNGHGRQAALIGRR